MPKKRKKKIVKENMQEDNSKPIAFLITFLSIIGFLIYLLIPKKDDYMKFYAKQSIVVFIASILAGIISWIVFWIPILGGIIRIGLNIIILVLWVLSWIYALSGEKKQVPLIGHYSENIKL
ncbi:MAG: DUF4870 domain-containing protein [Nanoarchaeota archaeon]|nr:DUF4870 domain-containing protein [Nanoarchaeota archaeon]